MTSSLELFHRTLGLNSLIFRIKKLILGIPHILLSNRNKIWATHVILHFLVSFKSKKEMRELILIVKFLFNPKYYNLIMKSWQRLLTRYFTFLFFFFSLWNSMCLLHYQHIWVQTNISCAQKSHMLFNSSTLMFEG